MPKILNDGELDANQAILTSYVHATDNMGERVQAITSAGGILLPWDYSLSGNGNHNAAALALCGRLDWTRDMVAGTLRGGSRVYVPIDARARWYRADLLDQAARRQLIAAVRP